MNKKLNRKDFEKYNPFTHPENTFGNEVHQLYKQSVEVDYGRGMCLTDFIDYLTKIRDRFGNMPVLYFSHERGTFTMPSHFDIDVVKEYFQLSGNLASASANIKKEKALCLFHG